MFYERFLKRLHKESQKTGYPRRAASNLFKRIAKAHVYYITEKFLEDLERVDVEDQEGAELILPFKDGLFFNLEKPIKLKAPLRPERHPLHPTDMPETNKITVKAIHIIEGDLLYQDSEATVRIGPEDLGHDYEFTGNELTSINIALICGLNTEDTQAFTIQPFMNLDYVMKLFCPAIMDDKETKHINGFCRFREAMIQATNGLSEEEYAEKIGALAVCTSELSENCPLLENAWPVLKLARKIIWSLIYHPINYKERPKQKGGHLKRLEREVGIETKKAKIPRLSIVDTKPLIPTTITVDPKAEPPELPRAARDYSSPVSGHWRCYTYCTLCGKRIKVKERHLTECPKCHRELELKEEFVWIGDHWSPSDPSLPKVNTQHNVEAG
jgi:hypothetical protein